MRFGEGVFETQVSPGVVLGNAVDFVNNPRQYEDLNSRYSTLELNTLNKQTS